MLWTHLLITYENIVSIFTSHVPKIGPYFLMSKLGPNSPKEKPLRLPVLKVHDVPDVGCVIVGRVETGSLRPGIKVRRAMPGLGWGQGKMAMTGTA